VIQKYVTLGDDIVQDVDEFIQGNFINTVLGVHLRLTDKFNCVNHGEPISGMPVDIEKYFLHIDKYLTANPDAQIFLATDSQAGLSKFIGKYGSSLLYQKNVIRSNDDTSVHHGIEASNFKKARDVLIDCLLLSRTSFLIKGISNVALCALFFNTSLEHFNINEFYNGDMRESFIPCGEI
jgi:hypothetical protein